MKAAVRCALLFFILCSATAFALGPGERVSTADKVAWLDAHAAGLRTINPKDHDYSDLEPLRQAIGGARIVLLGGSRDEGVMKARYRVVRFLHEEMGFNVLTSGLPLFDAEEFDRALDHGKTARPDLEDADDRFFWYFNPHPERLDVLSYILDSHKSEHPLHLSGYGWGISRYMVMEYSKRLNEFLDRVSPHLATPADRKAIQQLVVLSGPVWNPYGGTSFRFYPVSQKEWTKVLPPGMAAIQKIFAALGRLPASGTDVGEIVYFRQTLSILAYLSASQARRPLQEFPADSALAMAAVWRPKDKIIVWADNWAIGRNWPPVRISRSGRTAPPRSTGIEFARAYGQDAYSLAFREIKSDTGVLQVLAAGEQPKLSAVDGDLESLLHATGKPYSFVNFRSVPAGHWLRTPLSARIVNGSQVDVWPDHFDGLVMVDIPVVKEHK